MQGKIMNFTEADELKGNPHFSDPDAKAEGYFINCQTCTMTYELRRRGFPVEALPNKNDEFYKVWCPKNNLTWNDRFLNPDGSRPIKTRPSVLRDTITAKVGFIEDATKETGRYELYLKWKSVRGRDGGAHVMIVERQKDGNLLWFDPQSGKHGSSKTFNGFMKSAVPVKLSVLRIDDKISESVFPSSLSNKSDTIPSFFVGFLLNDFWYFHTFSLIKHGFSRRISRYKLFFSNLTHTGFGFLFGVIIHLENYRPTESRNRLLTLKSKLSSDFVRLRSKDKPFY